MEPVVCLLIDDDHEDHEIFNIALAQTNIAAQCVAISNPLEALELLSQKKIKPDFIFVDFNMPRLGATECIARIKMLDEFSNATLVAISTFAPEKDINELEKMGARFVLKPNKIDHYEDILSEILTAKVNVNGN